MDHDEQGIGSSEGQDIDLDDVVVPEADVQPDEEDKEVVSKAAQYIDKADLTQCLREWRIVRLGAISVGGALPDLPPYACKAIIAIANGLSFKWNFRSYTYRDEMVQDAIFNTWRYIHNFNPDAPTKAGVPNPFWYISTICTNTFKSRIRAEKRQHYFKLAAVDLMADDILNDSDYLGQNPSIDHRAMIEDFRSKARSYETSEDARKADEKVRRPKTATPKSKKNTTQQLDIFEDVSDSETDHPQ